MPTDYEILKEVITYAQGGLIYIGNTTDGFAAATLLTPHYHTGVEISLVFARSNFYLVDGLNALRMINGSSGVVSEPAATAGALPTNARLLWLFRDRLWHGRFPSDPYNYYASKSGDFLNYDASDRTQVGAFAGNNTQQAGLLGDILTAAIPYGDISCVMGMANSIAVMRGDPKSGGSIDTISREVGIVRPSAWARDPDGNLYFMSRDGLYMLGANTGVKGGLYAAPNNASPKPMSRGRLDTTLGHIDHSSVKVVMAWDPRELGVKIMLLPLDPTQPTTSVFWHQQKDAFWVDQYPASKGPTAAVGIRGPSGGVAGCLLGCADGYLRILDATALTDDGSAISSLVKFGPLQFNGPMVNAKIAGQRMLWGDTSNFNAVYGWQLATDAVTAATASVQTTGTVTAAGYEALNRTRLRGGCGIFQIANAVSGKTWSMEKGVVLVAPSGRIRL